MRGFLVGSFITDEDILIDAYIAAYVNKMHDIGKFYKSNQFRWVYYLESTNNLCRYAEDYNLVVNSTNKKIWKSVYKNV